ncbi:GtrA family protein [Stackebrandtia soli]|uniref:GtrA family protein n=1 Tax=Stackebrandtia soli TaxID=1892856 RepID=UPI0039EB1140
MNRDETAARPGSPLIGFVRRIAREFGKFAGVGAIAYAVDTSLFNVATYVWHFDPLSAKALSTAVAATLAFIGNRFWTWRHRPRSGLHREYVLYFVFNIVGLGINLGCIAVYQLAADTWPATLDNPIALNIVANVLGVGLASLFRFHSYRTWVFPHSPRRRIVREP